MIGELSGRQGKYCTVRFRIIMLRILTDNMNRQLNLNIIFSEQAY